jgi:hypothetical protein
MQTVAQPCRAGVTASLLLLMGQKHQAVTVH